MKRFVVVGLFALAAALPARAQEKSADWLGPAVSDQTIAVILIDLERLDPQAVWDAINRLAPEKLDDRGANQMKAWRGRLVETGARQMAVAINLGDLPFGPFVVAVPTTAATAEKVKPALVEILARSIHGPATVRQAGNTLLWGGASVAAANLNAAPPPALAAALAAGSESNAAVRLVVLLADDVRKVIEQTVPQLPPPLGGASTTPVTNGFLWAVASVGLPPNPLGIEATIKTKDAAAATALANLLATLSSKASDAAAREFKSAFPKDPLPDFAKLAELLTPKANGDELRLSITEANGSVAAVAAIAKPIVAGAQRQAAVAQTIDNLKQIGLAMHNYHDTHGHFPPAALCDKQGKPLLSWRVLLLPFLDQQKLYEQFKLDEPWDSEHNRKLVHSMPAIFIPDEIPRGVTVRTFWSPGKTVILAPVHEGTAFPPGGKTTAIKDMRDGSSNTILAVRASRDRAVIWTKPVDLVVDLGKPLAGLEEDGGKRINVLMGDGSVRGLTRDDANAIKAMFTRAGGEAAAP